MTSKIKTGLGFILFLIAAGAAIGYYLYNKGPENIRAASSIKISAIDLYMQFDKDSSSAQKKFSGKVMEITGHVSDVSENLQKSKIVLLRTGNSGASVNCTLEEEAKIQAGENVVIKGICSGIGQGDPDLGLKGDVYISRAIILK